MMMMIRSIIVIVIVIAASTSRGQTMEGGYLQNTYNNEREKEMLSLC